MKILFFSFIVACLFNSHPSFGEEVSIDWNNVIKDLELQRFLDEKQKEDFNSLMRPFALKDVDINKFIPDNHDYLLNKKMDIKIFNYEYQEALNALQFFSTFSMITTSVDNGESELPNEREVFTAVVINGTAYTIAKAHGMNEDDANITRFITGFIVGLLQDGLKNFGNGSIDFGDNITYTGGGSSFINLSFEFKIP